MERYSEYKDSGVQWLGEIPGHWEISKLSSHFRQRSEKVSDKDYPPLSVSKQGVTPQLENVALSNAEGNARKLVKKGDYAVNSRSDRKGSCGVSKYEGSVSLITIVLEPFNINGEYIHYLFRSNPWVEEFYRNGRGIVADLWTTNYQMMKSMYLPVPPLPEQEAIAAYLDTKCGKIDQLLEGKQKQIELLAEIKQRIIADAVTRGLNPSAKMKTTDFPWLPEVPAHWDCVKLKSFCKENKEKNKGNIETRVLSLSYGKVIVKHDVFFGLVPESYEGYQIVNPGYIILRLTDLQNDQKSLRTGLVKDRGIITSAYVGLVVQNMNNKYAQLVLHSYDVMKIFYGMGGGLRQSMSYKEISNVRIPVPPISEQREIVAYLDKKIAKIDTLTAKLQQEIATIKEYKQRLISDVVTGQIKVCESC